MGIHVAQGKKYGAKVKGAMLLAEKQLDAIVSQATMYLMEDMLTIEAEGGRLPFRTGALRASVVTSVMGGFAATGPTAYRMVVKGFRAGQRLRAVFTKHYAPHLEYGTRNPRTGAQMITPRHFVLGAVRQWPKYVDMAVKRAIAGIRR